MSNENAQIISELQEIVDSHKNFINDYNEVLSNYSNKIMSKGDGIYGMYFPEPTLDKYFVYKGKITKDELKKDFVYYFDVDGKLLLTERYSDGVLLNAILFYYYDEKIEIVWYCLKKKMINIAGKVAYQNNILEKFVESGDVTRGIKSYKEYIFATNNDYINIKTYMRYSVDKEIIMKSKMKRM